MIPDLEIERAWALLFRGGPAPAVGSSSWRRELKLAFRRRVLETHPDRARVLGKPEAELRREFLAIVEAHRLLRSLEGPPRPKAFAPRPPRPERPSPRRDAPPRAPPREHFHRGPLPRGRLRFAEYLYYSGRVSWQALVQSIAWQRSQRPAIGRLAVVWGQLTDEDVRRLLESRRQSREHGTPFGEHALKLGMLTPFQLLALLGRQRRMQRRIGEFFVERGILSPDDIPTVRLAVIRHNARCRC